ncbi:hypothetical protein [Hydrogenophaga sp.]|uniref:hypothetical protein n=1 Tax=Hydrogenophaga sp. TaxID=1904254 RepID=UPI00261AE242|nr:hypothetical protein [Hydrogenophaga sp.]MCW5652351.1 hypothetical protein [Hydrogenophaga sp.]
MVTLAEWRQEGRGLNPAERRGVQSAGVTEADVAAGRLVRVQCAMMTDGWWPSLGLLPAGQQGQGGTVVRLRVDDAGDNDRLAVNPVLGPMVPPLAPGGRAYRAIPDWKERGLSSNFERVPLPAAQADRYLVVQGAYLVKCRP